nr:glycosyltransferase [Nocardiopsis baichengensis]
MNKGRRVAVEGVARLREEGYGNARLTLLGVPGEEIPRYQAQMDRRLGPGVVECKPYTSSTQEVQRERDRADVILMPSIREHFGLVASEALGEGIPLLAPEGAGATLFFTDEDRFPRDLTQGFIVHDEAHCRDELSEAPTPGTPRSALWAEAMADMIDNYHERLTQGTALRDQYLVGRYTSLHMANAIVEATRELNEGHAKQGEAGRLLAARASRVLPVSAGPTLEALERPRERQDMHHRALKTEDVLTEAGEAVRLARQGLVGPGQPRRARAVPHTPRRGTPRRGSERGPGR